MKNVSNLDLIKPVYGSGLKRKDSDCLMVSIDSSSTKTGISLFLNGKLWKVLLIDLKEEKDMDKRFKNMAYNILTLLMEYKPYILYIEETVVPRNVSTQRFLTRLQGVMYGWCIMNDCEFNTIRPTEWRKLLGFEQGASVKRDQLKKKAIEYVEHTFSIEMTEDAAESVCIGLAVLQMWNNFSAIP